ncbi:MAG: hypothetical protein GVY20_13080, partial [Bacteroidetes bacterium]|nr:hypothetical protein [Bacteroidota bacterium]
VTAEIDQPGTGNTGSIEFLLDEGHETFEDYEVEIQASGEDVKSVKDEVYLNIERVGELSLSMDPTDLLIEPGSSQTTEATLSRTNFEGEVTLSVVSSLPSGVTAEIDQPGTGDSGSVEFLLDEGHESFEDYPVEIQASGEGVKSVRDEVYLNIEEQLTKPSVTTESISSITENSAVSGGDVTDDGGADVTERGVCWDTSEEPTLDDQCTSDGEGTGNFESEITELDPDTEYYVRAYATNSEGTSYGNQQDFRTDEVQTYSIFGVVVEDDGTLIEGLDMLLIRHDQDSNLSTSTDNSGYYIFENLRAGDDYSVAPQSTDEFEPTNQRFDNLSSNQSQDFVRVPETYSISGTVFDGEGQKIEGLDMLLIRHDQGSNLTTTTDNSGDYIFEELRAGDDYTVAPQSTDEFEPTNQRFDNLQNDQTQDFDKVVEENSEWPRDTETEVVEVTNPVTGRTWMDRNLGANRAATSLTDEQAYGDLYQWGRPTDGHQKRNSETTTKLSSIDQPGHDDFILTFVDGNGITPETPYDWRSPQNDELWQGENGTNNPCPTGYRLPTETEWEAEVRSWSSNNASGAFGSPLKLIGGGNRLDDGRLALPGTPFGVYWSQTVDDEGAIRLFFRNADVGEGYLFIDSINRAQGYSVRCIKD